MIFRKFTPNHPDIPVLKGAMTAVTTGVALPQLYRHDKEVYKAN